VARGVDVAGSVIGAGATVTGAGVVRGSVIWPGAHAEAPLEGVVVTTRGTVVSAT
jgi:mannose-1-phosphate guanylyltransferase